MTTDNEGWFCAMRSRDAFELLTSCPNAYLVALVIAHRARWREGFNRHGLAYGEALLGDFEKYGMSEQNYRTAKAQLEKWGFATFKATNKGTIGKLIDTRLFALTAGDTNDPANGQPTDSQRTANGQLTTNEEGNKVIRGRMEAGQSAAVAASAASGDAEWLAGLRADAAYAGLDVDREHAKMIRWCREHRKQASRKRLINWLNRCERPLTTGSATTDHSNGF